MYLDAACPTCASLRAATLRLVGEDGLAGLSLSSLSESSGLSPADVCGHYPSDAACLYDAYDELARALLLDFADAFERSDTWNEGLMRGQKRLLRRMAERPSEARLWFVEVLKGDRELLRRRDSGCRQMLELLIAQHRRWNPDDDDAPEMQLELLIGASFQLISARVADRRISELPALGPALDALANAFEPVAA
jgi:AcrR family transcriptional regulator